MTDSSIKKIKSCKGWGTFTSVCMTILIILMCITLAALVLVPLLTSLPTPQINPNSILTTILLIFAVIISFSPYALIIVYVITFIAILIWCVKAFNLITDKKHTFTQYSWATFIFRFLPIFSLYTKYRILKDLYMEHSNKDTYSKRILNFWYVFYLLCWGTFFVIAWAKLEDGTPEYNFAMILILLFALISFIYFNKVLKRINKYQDSVIKGETVDNGNIIEEKKDTKVKTKKINIKYILYVIIGLIAIYLLVYLGISSYGKKKHGNTQLEQVNNTIVQNKKQEEKKQETKKQQEKKEEKKKETKENDSTMSDQQVFENTIKCQEFKDKFFDEMTSYFTSNSIYDQKIGSKYYPLLQAFKENITIFYSPVTNSCIGTAYGTGAKWFTLATPEIVEGIFVVQDIFSSDRCKVKETIYYHDDILGERIDFFNKCDGLDAYDDEMFTTFTIPGDELYNNLNLAKEIFDNQVNYLKGN